MSVLVVKAIPRDSPHVTKHECLGIVGRRYASAKLAVKAARRTFKTNGPTELVEIGWPINMVLQIADELVEIEA